MDVDVVYVDRASSVPTFISNFMGGLNFGLNYGAEHRLKTI